MTKIPPRATRQMILRRTLLTLAVLTTIATAIVIGYAANLLAQGYAEDHDPQSLGGLAIAFALFTLWAAGLPLTLVSVASWAGYRTAARKHRELV